MRIGSVELRNPILLAPMSGITDAPFREVAFDLGAGLVVTEMIASEALARQREDTLIRAKSGRHRPFVVQLAGREAKWMAEGARIAADMGADLIDINMGCPAKQVTGGLSGSALMRTPDHALSLIQATVGAVSVPVSVKMRMGWDHEALNAPELARRAQDAGAAMITVHGRTRCQFFKGRADWPFIATVKAAVSVPVIANGDAVSIADTRAMLTASNADGAMIGRGARGRPWLPGRIAAALAGDRDPGDPPIEHQRAIVLRHYDAMLSHYGCGRGVRIARKHLGWYVEQAVGQGSLAGRWRARLCTSDDHRQVRRDIDAFYDTLEARQAA